MKKLAFALMGLLLASTSAFAAQCNLQDALAASPQIDEGCSGNLIHSVRDDKTGEVRTLILTAAHCIGNINKEYKVDFQVFDDNTRIVKKERYIAKALGTWYKGDIGLLELKDKKTFFEKKIKIAAANPNLKLGDPVLVVGYPLGYNLTVTEGAFGGRQTYEWDKAGKEYFRATPAMIFGNSGGSLLSDKSGECELLGVTSSIDVVMGIPITHMGNYVPSDQIREYLKIAVPEAVADPVAKVDPSKQPPIEVKGGK